ncbi:uncharacterized protein BP01DRAFT_112666 [Aspergillus saccharolyticus JOP 1030-1]|uniref:Uncharacterized protein n=1 Tax=Aspergillus saccharolyticus JOP 1030-1 TaxID=1450539 RepID=A0A319AAY3_9EURO|nr:hypothetical protein BP01DRAFT_112666 [Aspergillus saccharolyticus JOP 1030-1]PYH48798.1 hypothetical protein BP01DRAFT_112666 [Aspergillus saccharolyticus JOP 1030-1]
MSIVARSCRLASAKPVPSAVPKKNLNQLCLIASPRFPVTTTATTAAAAACLFPPGGHPSNATRPPSFITSQSLRASSGLLPVTGFPFLLSSLLLVPLLIASVGRSFVLPRSPQLVRFRGPFGLGTNHKHSREVEGQGITARLIQSFS